MTDTTEELRVAARSIALAGINGWGNLCNEAADTIDTLRDENKRLEADVKEMRKALTDATAAAAVPAIPDAITHTIQRALVKFSDSELERLRTLLEPENAAVAIFGMARIAARQNIDDADAALNWLAAAPKAAPAAQGDALSGVLKAGAASAPKKGAKLD